MPVLANTTLQIDIPTSCGVLILNAKGQLLLCHVTGTNHWDIPKGMRESGESTLHAAKRELREETGLEFDSNAQFEDLGGFDFRKHKRLHLYKMRAPESLIGLGNLVCTSYFSHQVTGEPTPEMDGFRWASRDEIESLCTLPMARQLLSLNW
ncbi:MAG: hydrolase [Herminiimonas sp.]|nr:hydrolase [Herminiimonas sp.]